MVTILCGSVNLPLLIPHILLTPFHKNGTVSWTAERKKKAWDVAQCKNTPFCSLSLGDLMFESRTHSSLKNYILEFSCMFLFPLPQSVWHHRRSKAHTAMLLVWCLTCSSVVFSHKFTDGVDLCSVYYKPRKIFPEAESLIHISFQILQLHFSEVHVCVWEGV